MVQKHKNKFLVILMAICCLGAGWSLARLRYEPKINPTPTEDTYFACLYSAKSNSMACIDLEKFMDEIAEGSLRRNL